MKTFIIATEQKGIIKALDLAPMAMRQAQAHAQRLRDLMPDTPIYVINKALA